MKTTLAELIDRYSIEQRKLYYGFGNKELVADVHAEIVRHLAQRTMNHMPQDVFEMIHAAVLLGIRNADIANSEFQIRAGQMLPMEEIGRRAVLTRRKLNDDRSKAKQELSEHLRENVETRHYGFGSASASSHITLDIQVPPLQSEGESSEATRMSEISARKLA